jgi:hypothetical protein
VNVCHVCERRIEDRWLRVALWNGLLVDACRRRYSLWPDEHKASYCRVDEKPREAA